MGRAAPLITFLILANGCADQPDPTGPLELIAITFNTGTSEGMGHDDPPDDGYTQEQAARSDAYYGDGLAWVTAVEAARRFLAEQAPDVIAFQEIFYSGDCPDIPEEARADFVCESWVEGDPTVAQVILGEGYQVMCNPGHPDKCAAVRRELGTFRGCDEDLCLEGMTGFTVEGCGSGARVGRAVIELVGGGELTLVNVHGTSGLNAEEQACRVRQVEQVFVDLGDGAPGVSGAANLVLGDLNTDPARLSPGDLSATRWNDFAGDEGQAFHFITDLGLRVEATYGGLANIDHVISDVAIGECFAAGVTEGHPAVLDAVYFDHTPQVCTLTLDRP